MQEPFFIDKEHFFNVYKKTSSSHLWGWNSQHINEMVTKNKSKIIVELSNTKYITWTHESYPNKEKSYLVFDVQNKKLTEILAKEVKPKSVRETLQNKEKNKSFIEK